MKKLIAIISISWYCLQVSAQTGEEMLKKMYDALHSIENMSYVMHRVDTFVSGTARSSIGYAILQKNTGNVEFPFLLYGRNGDKFEFIFNGDDAMDVNHHEKTFEFLFSKHYRTFIGHPAGQMIMPEIVLPELPFNQQRGYGYREVTYKEKPDRYIITLKYPDYPVFDIQNQFKEIHIDKQYFLPFYTYHFLETSLGERQVNEMTLTEVKVNEPGIRVPDFDYELLASYEQIERDYSFVNQLGKLLGMAAPELELENLEGERAKLSDLRGKVVLLNFWEIWCGPCIESIPKIKEMVDKYTEKDFAVWSVVSDDKTFSKVPSFVTRRDFNYPVYYGTKDDAEKYYVKGVPEYVIIDRDGIIKYATAGYSKNIEVELNKLLLE
ncbi:MAG TPA: TlpA disulfide reductase family protein [Cyclobacteriaceae bacterium]|nr:TlpA disulfide reductase family protein [Cyclobacteriaceae bacterium]